MKEYDIEIGSKLILTDMHYRVKAKNKAEAIKKVKELGFNCGKRLSSGYKGEFIAKDITEVKHTEYTTKYDDLEDI